MEGYPVTSIRLDYPEYDDGAAHQLLLEQEQWEREPKRICRTCGVEKPLASFPVNKQMLEGRLKDCKLCVKAWMFNWRQQNKERLWAKDREYAARPDVRAKTATSNEQWRKENRHKIQIHYQFHQALRAGLVKPLPCWVCGEKAEAHHPDYSAPLDVVWLCRSHHKQAHALAQGLAK